MTVSDEQMDSLWEAIQAIAEVPTGYFEAKPKRAVGFDEIRAALVPNNMDSDLTQQLADKGVDIVEYDPEVEGDRTAKLNEVADAQQLKFSLSPEQQKIDNDYMELVNSKNIHDILHDVGMEEVHELVDKAAKDSSENCLLRQARMKMQELKPNLKECLPKKSLINSIQI